MNNENTRTNDSPGTVVEERTSIRPDTTIEDILSRHPECLQTILRLIPRFQALTAIELRTMVFRSTTLSDAAKSSGISIGELITALHRDLGFDDEIVVADENADVPADSPAWVMQGTLRERFDARPMLENGEHPLAKVMSDLAGLRASEIYELVTPFVPFPLIERASGAGCESWTFHAGKDNVRTFFHRR